MIVAQPGARYIPSHTNLGNHPKLLKLTKRLEIGRVQAVGHLTFMWWWAMSYAPDGDVSQFSDEDIAIGAAWDGDETLLVKSLIECGFIDDDRTIHDWNEYGGKLLRTQQTNAEKQQRHRNNQDSNRNVTVTSPSLLKEKRREEKREEETNPVGLETRETKPERDEGFEEFWKIYPNHNGAKTTALEQWHKLKPDERLKVSEVTPLWNQTRQWQEGYAKHCDRFLRLRLWDQDVPVDPPQSPNGHGPPTKPVTQRDNIMSEAEWEATGGGGWKQMAEEQKARREGLSSAAS